MKKEGSLIKSAKKSVKAQGGVITVILLILLSIGAFVVLWNVYYYLVIDKASGINTDTFLVDGEFEYYLPNDLAIISVHRKAGEGEITGLKILFNEKDTGKVYSYNTTNYPKPLETKVYVIKADKLDPKASDIPGWDFSKIGSISLYYLFPDKKISRELEKKEILPITKCLYTDADGDGYGTGTCIDALPTSGRSPFNGDCDDDKTGESECPTTILGCTSIATKDCAICKNPSMPEVCDGVDNNCDGQKDEGITTCLKNYTINTATINTLDETSCSSWTTVTSFPTEVNLTFSFNFYNETINKIYICKQGFLSTNGNCWTGSIADSSTGISILKSIKGISPYLMDSGDATKNPTYCVSPSNNYLRVNWTSGSFKSKLIIYNTGEIKYSYLTSGSQLAEVGISYGDGKYYNEIVKYNDNVISSDYKLTLP